MRLYYNNGQALNLVLVEDDGNEITFVINRLKAVTPGCQVTQVSIYLDSFSCLHVVLFCVALPSCIVPVKDLSTLQAYSLKIRGTAC